MSVKNKNYWDTCELAHMKGEAILALHIYRIHKSEGTISLYLEIKKEYQCIIRR